MVEPTAQFRPATSQDHQQPSNDFSSLPFWMGVGLSVAWVGVVVLVLALTGGAQTFLGTPLTTWALGLSAVVAPVALIWMVTAYLQRAADVQSATEPLRYQLGQILNENGAAENRVRRFNHAVRQQLELLKNATQLGQNEMRGMLEQLQREKADIADLVERSRSNVGQASAVVDAAREFDRLIEKRLESLQEVDGKLTGTGDALGRQTNDVRMQLEKLLRELDDRGQQIARAVDSATAGSQHLQDAIRNQETDLLAAADAAAEKVAGATRLVEQQIESFYEKAQDARGEAVRAADMLLAQGNRIADLTTALPTRAHETEATLRRAIDLLTATEATAGQQTERMAATLAAQTDQMQKMLNSFSGQIEQADSSLLQRRSQLETLVNHISSSTATLADIMGTAVDKFEGNTATSVQRLRDITSDIQNEASRLTQQVGEATGRYEAAASRVGDISESSTARLGDASDKLSRMILQLEAIDEHSRTTGRDVQDRATAAVSAMQEFQDKLTVMRDKVTVLADMVVDRFSQGANANQQVITRIGDAAQAGVQTLSLAAEALARHEDTLADRARTAEAGLRDVLIQLSDRASQSENNLRLQVAGIANLLKETQSQIDNASGRLSGFAGSALEPITQALTRVDQATQLGLEQLVGFQMGVAAKADQVAATTARLGDLSMAIDNSATTALGTVDTLFSRIGSLQATQQTALADTHRAFDEVGARLQNEVGNFNQISAQSVGKLKEAGSEVTTQILQLREAAQQGGTQLQSITGTLQNDVAHTRALLQKQAADLIGDLSQVQAQFNTVGDGVKLRADEAYALIERIALRFQDVTQGIAQAIDDKAQLIGKSVERTREDTGALGGMLNQKLSLIDQSNEQLQAVAAMISGATNKAMTQLQTLSERSERTQETIATSVAQNLNRLDEANMALQRHSGSINEGAQSAVLALQKAGSALAEQGGRLLDLTGKSDQQLRSLAGSASSLAEHTAQIRIAMEQQSTHLVQQLNGAMTQLQNTSAQLQQTVATALMGAEQSSSRFDELSGTIGNRLTASSEQVRVLTQQAEASLQGLGNTMLTHLNALEQTAQQIAQQQNTVSSANDNQQNQLVMMFERLGMAHASSSEAAERTINRLNETLVGMSRQLSAFNEQTQSSLAAVRTTGAGFADQAGVLTSSAQQAEQQVRAVLSVTAALADQAQKMREQTQAETSRASETLATMLGQIDGSSERLKIQTANVLATVDQASSRFAASTREAGGALVEQTGELDQLAARAAQALAGYGTQLREQQQLLFSAEGEAQQRTQNLAAIAQQASQRLAELSNQLQLSETQAGDASSEVISSISQIRAAVLQDLQQIVQQADLAATQATGATQRISEAEAKLRGTTETLRAETLRVPTLVGNAVTQMESANVHLRQHVDQAAKTLGTTTTLFNDTASAAQTVLSQIGLRMKATTDEAQGTLAHYTKMLNDQMAAMKQGTGSFSGEQQKLLLQANATLSEMLQAAERLGALREAAEMAATKFGSQLQNMDVQAAVVADRITGSTLALQEQMAQLAQATQRSEAQIKQATSGSHDHLDRVRTTLQAQVDSINTGFTQMAKQLEQMYAGIKGATADTFTDIEKLAGRFRAASEGGTTLMMEKTQQLRGLTEQAAELLGSFGAQLDNQLDRLAVTTEQLQKQGGTIGRDVGDALRHFEGIGKQLEQNRTLLAAMGEQISKRLANIGEGTEDQIRSLAEQAEAAANLVRNATNTWQDTTEALARGAISARGEVVSVSHAMDALQEKANTMRGSLQQQGEQLIASLAQLIAQLESAGDSMQYTADPLVSKIESGLKKIS
jgi:chromosome segregation ATPase